MNGHYLSPCLLPRGSVTENVTYKTQVSLLNTYIEENYLSRHTVAYVPKQLREMRRYLLSQNSLEGLMVWTLLIVAIKQFLRICEAISLRHDSFDMTLASVSTGHVKSLATKVQGKCDSKEVHLSLWSDTECSEFCPVNALLIWIALSGTQGGFIFPDKDFFKNPKSKHVKRETHVSYDRVLKTIKKLSQDVLKMDFDNDDKDVIVGTHFARKTGVLLATWSFLSESESHRKEVINQPIMEAAFSNDSRNKSSVGTANTRADMRHAGTSVQSTKTYIRDSATMYEFVKDNTEDLHDLNVSRYRGILIGSPSMARKIINSKNKMTLSELANWYVFEILQIDRKNLPSITDIFNKASNQTSDKSHKLPPSQRFLHSLIGSSRYETYCGLVEKEAKGESVVTEKKPPKEDSRFVCLPSHFRSDFNKSKRTEDKLDIAVAAVKEAEVQRASGKALQIKNTKCDDYFVLRRYGKLVDCLNTCFRGDTNRFSQKCPKITSKFVCAGRTPTSHSYLKATK